MIDLIKESAVPANVMRSAARGALSLPPGEMVEILVYLAGHHLFGEQAQLSLAGYDEKSMHAIAVDPQTPVPVLEYLAAAENVRPALLPDLLQNPSLPQMALLQLAMCQSSNVLAIMAASPRTKSDLALARTLYANDALPRNSASELKAIFGEEVETLKQSGDVLNIEDEIQKYVTKHAREIAASEAQEFALSDESDDEKQELQIHRVRPRPVWDEKKLSPLQKIARLGVGGRIQLAMKGNKEERAILIRDGSKIVSAAVLESPKITDQEVETFAALKNVNESVLRAIASKRKFMKLYPVMRALTFNPRTPLDVALPLLKSMLIQDLRYLSMNKNVSDTLRKLAFKLFKQKSSSMKKAAE